MSRADVIAAAATLLAQGGADGLTMRGLAKHLGISASTLYWHVQDKTALLHAVIADSLDGIEIPTEGDWETRFTAYLRASREALRARPAVLPLFWTAGWAQPDSVLRVADALTGLVAESGTPDVADAYYAVLSFLVGFVQLETTSPDTPAFHGDAARYPHLAAHAPASDRAGMDRRFDAGVALLVAGLRAR